MSQRASGSGGVDAERWLATRDDAAPSSLCPRLAAAVRAPELVSDGSLAGQLCGAGEALLVRVLTGGCASRSAAPDLLAADALVTYAFEAAAESAEETSASIEGLAAAAMRRVAARGVGDRA